MSKFKVEVLEQAQIEIEEIISVYVKLSGTRSARRLVNKLYDAFSRLAAFPLSGPQLQDKELQLAGYRLIVVGEYLCIYRVMETTIYIYHVVHGSTNYPQLFKENS